MSVKKRPTPTAAATISRVEDASLLRELNTMQPASTTALQAAATWKGHDGGFVRKNQLFQQRSKRSCLCYPERNTALPGCGRGDRGWCLHISMAAPPLLSWRVVGRPTMPPRTPAPGVAVAGGPRGSRRPWEPARPQGHGPSRVTGLVSPIQPRSPSTITSSRTPMIGASPFSPLLSSFISRR